VRIERKKAPRLRPHCFGAFEGFYGLLQYLTGWQQIFAYVKKYYVEDATGTYINRNHLRASWK